MPSTTDWRTFNLASLVSILFTGLATVSVAQELDPRLSNYDISQQIRFHNSDEAEVRRDKLIRCIWKDGLPKSRPTVTENLVSPEEMSLVRQDLIARVDLYTADVSSMDFQSLSYVAYPVKTVPASPRLAIVHAGHLREGPDHYLDSGLKETVERLLENGFVVAVMQMPLVAWNQDNSGVLPDGTTFQIEKRSVAGHDELFAKIEPIISGQIMAFFLEPVVQVTNELLARHPDHGELWMVGLSGGGWTTHFSSALDSRIRFSVPVAGALPLYARPFSRGSTGDAEQNYALILGEEDTDGDGILDRAAGVCSWLEIFALGALGPAGKQSRKQVQVINFDDSCCFSGPVYQTYHDALAKSVATISTGDWQVYIDRSHTSHLISEKAIDDVLMPMVPRTVEKP